MKSWEPREKKEFCGEIFVKRLRLQCRFIEEQSNLVERESKILEERERILI